MYHWTTHVMLMFMFPTLVGCVLDWLACWHHIPTHVRHVIRLPVTILSAYMCVYVACVYMDFVRFLRFSVSALSTSTKTGSRLIFLDLQKLKRRKLDTIFPIIPVENWILCGDHSFILARPKHFPHFCLRSWVGTLPPSSNPMWLCMASIRRLYRIKWWILFSSLIRFKQGVWYIRS